MTLTRALVQLLDKQGAMSSHEIISFMIEKLGVSHSAARKRLERAVKGGLLLRFMALNGRQYLYCLPRQRNKARVKALAGMRKWKPKLYRLYRALNEAKILSLWEASRITAFPRESYGFGKILSGVELLGLGTRRKIKFEERNYEFLISKSLKASGRSRTNLLRNQCEQLLEEESFVYLTRRWLKWNGLARGFAETSMENFRYELFDSLGRSVSPRFSLVIFDVNVRRPISRYEMQGFIERVYKFIFSYRSHKIKFPVFSFFIAKDFKPAARKLGENRGIKMIKSEYVPRYRLKRGPGGLLLHEPQVSERDLGYVVGIIHDLKELRHSTQTKGIAFEATVERAFRLNDYKTEWRKEYFTENGNVTERWTKRPFTDIDIQAMKENSASEIVLCECRNWNQEIDRNKLLSSLKKLNKVAEYLLHEKYATLRKPLVIKIVFIGPVRRQDKEMAKRLSKFEIEIITKQEFKRNYCEGIRELRRHSWIFK